MLAIGLFHKQPLDDILPFEAILVRIVVSFAVLPCCVQQVRDLPSIKRAHYAIRHANFFRHFSHFLMIPDQNSFKLQNITISKHSLAKNETR